MAAHLVVRLVNAENDDVVEVVAERGTEEGRGWSTVYFK